MTVITLSIKSRENLRKQNSQIIEKPEKKMKEIECSKVDTKRFQFFPSFCKKSNNKNRMKKKL